MVKRALARDRVGHLPGQFFISNQWAIGCLPMNFGIVDDLISMMIAPVCPYAYIFAYTGGSHKKIKGHFTFFHADVGYARAVVGNVVNFHPNPKVYVVMCGRMTLHQRDLVKKRCLVDVGKFNVLFDWMKINNPVFANFQLPTELHPKIIGGEQTLNNTDGEVDLAVESVCEVKYYFPSTGDPNDTSGTFEDSTEFATAIMSGMTPTLLFHPGNYANDRNTSLEEMFPVQFPFGVGGPKALRLTHVSEEHGLQHLMRLSLHQFHRHMFILVGYHVFNRILSFRTGLIMSKGYVEGEVLANRVSSLTVQEVMTAGLRRRHGVRANLRNTADGFLHAISTACAPIGHSNEAADKARKRYFALWEFFGPGSIFVTVSPCDERSFHLKLFAGQIECKLLPSLCWTDEQCIHDMIV